MTEQDYMEVQKELARVEQVVRQQTGRIVMLADMCCDAENVVITKDQGEYWNRMVGAAWSSAGERASDYGLDINELVGRIVY